MALARGLVASDVAESDRSSTSITSPLSVQTVDVHPTSALPQESPTTGHRHHEARPPDKQPGNSIRGFLDNFMDYTSDACRTRFTDGQYARMKGVIGQYRNIFL